MSWRSGRRGKTRLQSAGRNSKLRLRLAASTFTSRSAETKKPAGRRRCARLRRGSAADGGVETVDTGELRFLEHVAFHRVQHVEAAERAAHAELRDVERVQREDVMM